MQQISREFVLSAKNDQAAQLVIVEAFQKQISFWIKLNGCNDSKHREDIHSRAQLAILQAIKEFDASAEFSTFVYNRIRDGVQQGIADTSHISRVKPADRQWRTRFQKKRAELTAKLGYSPSHSEVLHEMGYTGTKLRNYLSKLSVFNPPMNLNRAKNADDSFFEVPDWTDEKNRVWNEIMEELHNLPPEEADAIRHMKLQEETAAEYAESVGIRPKEAYNRMYSGMRKLKAVFA